jgi:hypothetical protein
MYDCATSSALGVRVYAVENVAFRRGRPPTHLPTCYGANRPGALGQVRNNLQRDLSGWTNTTNYSAGASYNQILVADFDSATTTVKVTGTSVYGAIVVVNGAPAGLTQTAINKSYPYSNTATTITIGSDTFNARYGPLYLGMPQWAVFGGISSGGCSASAIAIRQSPLSVSLPAR